MSLSQIKFIPTTTFPSASRHLQRNTHFLWRGRGGNNRIRPAAVLTSVFTKSVWIKEKAVVLAQEQVCTKGRSSTAFLKFLEPVSCTHTDAQMLALQRYQALWLYVQSACILLGCILKSSAASLGGPVDRRINQRDVKTADIIIWTGKFRQRRS